jgi:hypothetical protein
MIYLFCEIDEIKDNIKNIKEEKELWCLIYLQY